MAQIYELISENFLHYASYVVRERAIPHMIDGLKPVQRRILHTLFELNDGRFHKVSNVVGQCMRYHPHGDASIYAALVNLAHRGGLIETQGNFGNPITGDQASASRYIECRITAFAKEILFRPKITEYIDSYDGRAKETSLFPATIPLILILGVEGIAVGMATTILPHNIHEVIQSLICALQGTTFTLYPDFFSGGLIDVSEYADGQGKVRIRAKIEVVSNKSIIIRQVPYGKTTDSLIRSIEAAVRSRKISIMEINDYTADEVEIELKTSRGVQAASLIDNLYAFTDCEVSYTVNLLVIKDNTPVIKTVKEVIVSHANLLRRILEKELKLKYTELNKELIHRTLEQIFIEHKIYQDIESIPDLAGIHQIIRTRFRSYLKKYILQKEDIDTLLRIPVRRISLFDRQKVAQELKKIKEDMRVVKKQLSNITLSAIQYLQKLIEIIPQQERKTEITSFDRLNARELAAKNLILFYHREKGFLGTKVPSGIKVMYVSEFDRVLIIQKDGNYTIVEVPERLFVGDRVLDIHLADKEELSQKIFNILYQNEVKQVYLKRSRIDKFITGRTYRLIPESHILLDVCVDISAKITLHFSKKPRMKITSWSGKVNDYNVKGIRSSGVRLSVKQVRKAMFLRSQSRRRQQKD